ncbi:MAG: hypothetical protein ACOC44_04730 [Promethearchaeia archaeon]
MNIHIFNIGECGKCSSSMASYFTSNRYPFNFTDDPEKCDILLLVGCMLKTQSQPLIDFWKKMPKDHQIAKIGNCSTEEESILHFGQNSDLRNKAIDKENVAELIPVDSYVKGCPPELEDLEKFFKNLV